MTYETYNYFNENGLVALLENHGMICGSPIVLSESQKNKISRLEKRIENSLKENKYILDGVPYGIVLHKELNTILGIDIFDEPKLEFDLSV